MTTPILILGGTGFIGPWEVEAALARGHEVTLFNRGRTRPDLFPDLEKLRGDRDPEEGEGLSALAGRTFDVVIDNSGYIPSTVRDSARLLKDRCGRYIYTSTVAVYDFEKVNSVDISSPLLDRLLYDLLERNDVFDPDSELRLAATSAVPAAGG